jgi:hypothetical protein
MSNRYSKTDLRLRDIYRAMNRRVGNLKENYRHYRDCTISDNFKDRFWFVDWAKNQVGYNNKSSTGRYWELDKDILFKNNRHYSEDFCVFVPSWLNQLVKTKKASRGDTPIGVCLEKDRSLYRAQYTDTSGKLFRKSFTNIEEAFLFYKAGKEGVFKSVADILYNENCVDPRIPEALWARKVEIDD